MRYFPVYIALIIIFTSCSRETGTEPVDDNLPPSPPTGLLAYYASDGAVGLEWNPNPEPDINSYRIYRADDDLTFLPIDTTKNIYYIDAPLNYETNYSYQIKAVDNLGNISDFSNRISVVPRNRYSPYQPRGVAINAQNRVNGIKIDLVWEPGSEYDISGYKIYRDIVQGFDPDSSNYWAFSTDYFYTDSLELEVLQDYYYRITRVDWEGLESENSAEISDYILDVPKNIFPADGARLDYFSEFTVETCAREANYKILISESEIFSDPQELSFSSDGTGQILNVPLQNLSLTSYRKYYWQVLAYTENQAIPNSFSSKTFFVIEPDEAE